MIEETIDRFWNENILKDIAPEPTDIEDLRHAYPVSKVNVRGDILTADDSMMSLFRELCVLKESISEQKSRETEVKERIEAAMMGYGALVSDDGTLLATRGPKEMKKKLDLETLRSTCPDVWKRYVTESTVEEFDEKSFKKDCRELYDGFLITPPPPEDPEFKVLLPRKKAERKIEKVF